MTQMNVIPNEEQLELLYVGREASIGDLVVPTFKLYGKLDLQPDGGELQDNPEYDGSLVEDHNPIWSPQSYRGSYSQILTFEDGPLLASWSTRGSITGTSDGNATPGYSWAIRDVLNYIDIDTLSFERGFPGLPFAGTMLYQDKYTIKADVDDSKANWMYDAEVIARSDDLKADGGTQTATGGSTSTVVRTGAGYTVNAFAGCYVRILTGPAAGNVRRILSNDATTLTIDGVFTAAVANTNTYQVTAPFTAGIPNRTREAIRAPGTTVAVDPASGVLGATLLSGRVVSFSVSHYRNTEGKQHLDDVDTLSKRIGFGSVRVDGVLRVEFDRREEYDYWRNRAGWKMRIASPQGAQINTSPATYRSARIDIFNGRFSAPRHETWRKNKVMSLPFRAYYDQTQAHLWELFYFCRTAALL